jgi:hypothetical protein
MRLSIGTHISAKQISIPSQADVDGAVKPLVAASRRLSMSNARVKRARTMPPAESGREGYNSTALPRAVPAQDHAVGSTVVVPGMLHDAQSLALFYYCFSDNFEIIIRKNSDNMTVIVSKGALLIIRDTDGCRAPEVLHGMKRRL